MRIKLHRVPAATVAVLLSGCAATSTAPGEPVSFAVQCPPDQNVGECLRTVSEFCGSRGYDVFDDAGKPIDVAELKYVKATARCKTTEAD
jgi:hypothetical protein